MTLDKLEFPEPYKHEHPPVCDGSVLFEEQLTLSQKAADWVAETVGSWKFIFFQTAIFGVWIFMNFTGWFNHWDPYPFILMNLVISVINPMQLYHPDKPEPSERRERIVSHQHCLINEKAEEEARIILDHLSAQNTALTAIYEAVK